MYREEDVRKVIWLSYDLGIQGDYEGLYAWLDDHGARECGDSIAYFPNSYDENFHDSLESDLRSAVSINKRTRIYVVYRDEGRVKGRFIFGGRKRAPWEGYGSHEGQDEDDADSHASGGSSG